MKSMEKIILDIAGMRCGTCAVGIELALGKKRGVKSERSLWIKEWLP